MAFGLLSIDDSRRTVIRVPVTPPSSLLPNSRVHFREQARVKRALRADIRTVTPALETSDSLYAPGEPVACQIRIFWERGRDRPDPDNLLAAMKAPIDELEALGYFPNDRWLHHHPIVQEEDPDGLGYTEVTLWPANNAIRADDV